MAVMAVMQGVELITDRIRQRLWHVSIKILAGFLTIKAWKEAWEPGYKV